MKLNLEKYEITRHALKGRLTQYSKGCGWVLCVGAGISSGLFPSWDGLAIELLNLTSLKCSKPEIKGFLKNFGPEALMQAAVNALSRETIPEVPKHLAEALYGKIRLASGSKWDTIAKALTSSKPSNLNKEEWSVFERFVSSFKMASAPQVAKAIARVADSGRRPEAILSFNAEPLLYALINCYFGIQHPNSVKDNKVKVLKRLSHDLATLQRGQIPYYYVHGILPVPGGQARFNNTIAHDKLVFTEAQYLQLSRSNYSWQSATFLSSCIHHRCVFIGLSFSDPNLRRWLAWEHEGKTIERRKRQLREDRLSHIWLKKRPNKRGPEMSSKQQLIQRSVEHLGIQVVWLDDWSEAGEVLDLMLQDTQLASEV